jgi:cytochrome c5
VFGAEVRDGRLRAATAGMVGLALLSACGGAKPPATLADRTALAAAAAQRQPADPELADLYIHACRNCHANAASGAPLTDDREAWRPRWQQGPALLLAHTLQGFNGMPAGGQCPRCTVRDYEALIRFMAHQ